MFYCEQVFNFNVINTVLIKYLFVCKSALDKKIYSFKQVVYILSPMRS